MDPSVTALVGTVVGGLIAGCVAVVNSYLTSRNQSRVEREKARLARDETLAKELREHVGAAARSLFAAQHSLEWFTWHASPPQSTDHPSAEAVKAYEDEMHRITPELLGALAEVAASSPSVYEALNSWAIRIFDIDATLAQLILTDEDVWKAQGSEIRDLYHASIEMWQTLPGDIARIMESVRSGQELAPVSLGSWGSGTKARFRG